MIIGMERVWRLISRQTCFPDIKGKPKSKTMAVGRSVRKLSSAEWPSPLTATLYPSYSKSRVSAF